MLKGKRYMILVDIRLTKVENDYFETLGLTLLAGMRVFQKILQTQIVLY